MAATTEIVTMVQGNILALQIEYQAMLFDNEIRKMQGLDTFNYSPDDFYRKAQEVRDAVNELFKY